MSDDPLVTFSAALAADETLRAKLGARLARGPGPRPLLS